MLGAIGIVAMIGVALLINRAVGGLGQGIVGLFEKMGLSKTASYVFSGCIFLVVLGIIKVIINNTGIFS